MKLKIGNKVSIRPRALKQAKTECGTDVSATGFIVAGDDELITVQHESGDKVDWEMKDLIPSCT